MGVIERVAIVTDAWTPQINGVVRTLRTSGEQLEAMGIKVFFITPQVRNSMRTKIICSEVYNHHAELSLPFDDEGP